VADPAMESKVIRRACLGTALLALAALGRPCAAGDDPGAKPAVPSSELVKAGAVWDPPPDPLSISLAADGTISLLGHEVGLDELREALSDATKDPIHREPDGESRIDVVLRVAPSLPWAVVQWVMMECSDARVRMHRLHFAVASEAGDPEGVIPAFLPEDRGGLSPVAFAPDPSVRAALFASEELADRGSVFAALRAALAATRRKTVEIETPFRLLPRAGHVLSVLDLALRAGAQKIDFAGAPMPLPRRSPVAATAALPGQPGSLAWLRAWVAAHGKSDPAGLTVRVDRTSIDATSPPVPLPPPPPRHSRSLHGAYGDPAAEPEPDIVPAEPPGLISAGGDNGVRTFPERGLRRSDSNVPPDVRADETIDRALAWLAAHQAADGGWEAATFGRWCDQKSYEGFESTGAGEATYDVGVTGLALLAFLGAGYTNRSEGPYGKVVGNGLLHLRKVQDAEGCFGARTTPQFVYNHAIATLALVECFGMNGSSIYKGPAQRGLDFIAALRNPGLAWRYGPKPGDNDTSITGWMTLALVVAKRINDAHEEAGWPPPELTIDAAAFDGARAWIEKMTDPASDRVGYQQRGTSPARPADRVDAFPGNRSEALTAIGVLLRVLLGEDPATSERVKSGTDLLVKLPPVWNPKDGSIDLYYWQFGALAMAQLGTAAGEAWRASLSKALVEHQRTDGGPCGFQGSWDPIDPWGPDGGRVYMTAMAALALEAPYRYAAATAAMKK